MYAYCNHADNSCSLVLIGIKPLNYSDYNLTRLSESLRRYLSLVRKSSSPLDSPVLKIMSRYSDFIYLFITKITT